jgi:ATP-binding cassette subfamily B protein
MSRLGNPVPLRTHDAGDARYRDRGSGNRAAWRSPGNRGTIAVGDIQAFIQYIRNFTHPISQVAQVTNMLQSTVAAAERVFEFLDGRKSRTTQAPVPSGGLSDPSSSAMYGSAMTLRSGDQRLQREGVAGMKVAIVGPPGRARRPS